MEILVGGLAAASAGILTNPLEVLKIRMQLQGELQKKGQHAIHYKNIFHASYMIVKNEGVLSLQKGLVPALWVQFIMNGFRFGTYHYADKNGYLRDEKGNLVLYKNIFISGMGGVVGHYLSNPFFMVKTRMQSKAAESIAVGYQHQQKGSLLALRDIFKEYGLKGFFRGGVAVFPRAFVASVSQLTTFTYTKRYLGKYEYLQDKKILTSFIASMIGGIAISVLVTPFDLILTRLYNQPVDNLGRGLLYNNYLDCVSRIYRIEGISAFYKGVGPMYFRLGPHSVLSLMFWDKFREWYDYLRVMRESR
ncbi:solute carrier family 25 member 35-like [Coccinella septempunctata]|uniref:solute carrier family 25 member 35-like n=1 Tax=Coccinella septempunctata TaxID=41139 RepID=UPI001D06B8CF|nr:solute carrier family 25 member 35-like [Coccinella septempunctata]